MIKDEDNLLFYGDIAKYSIAQYINKMEKYLNDKIQGNKYPCGKPQGIEQKTDEQQLTTEQGNPEASLRVLKSNKVRLSGIFNFFVVCQPALSNTTIP